MARYISLYSGSSGNCSIVEEGGYFIIMDIGKSARLTRKAIDSLGLDIRGLQGVFISHEHSDHIGGLNVFLKSVRTTVYSGADTLDYMAENGILPQNTRAEDLNFAVTEVGPFSVKGFDTPHDSLGCLGFSITTMKGSRMSMATDLGFVPDGVLDNLKGAGLVVLESNYDPTMLKDGPYPYYLKRRISSNKGHLSNPQSSDRAIKLIESGAEKIQFCHLSNNNNTPDLAVKRLYDTGSALGLEISKDVLVKVNSRHDITSPTEF